MTSTSLIHAYGDHVDTDTIIPGQYLTARTERELGAHCLEGLDPEFINRVRAGDVIVAGRNFGCGSSREHAPQALYRFGHRAVIAESFAEIFFGNSTTLGVPCVKMSQQDIAGLAAIIESDPAAMITIDLTENKVTVADVDFSAEISMPGHAREALTTGRWDSIADLVDGLYEVKNRVAAIPYLAS